MDIELGDTVKFTKNNIEIVGTVIVLAIDWLWVSSDNMIYDIPLESAIKVE